jgi:hypothetical protein
VHRSDRWQGAARGRASAIVVAIAIAMTTAALTACGGGDADGDGDDRAGAGAASTEATSNTDAGDPATDSDPPVSDDPAPTTDGDVAVGDEGDVDQGSDTGEGEAAASGSSSVFPWLPEIVVLTEPSDDPRPLLEWEPVEGAVEYSVTVSAPDGRPYWAWRTEGTSVHLGGDPRLDDDQSGPSTVSGMTVSVIAFDAEQRPLAASVEAILRP